MGKDFFDTFVKNKKIAVGKKQWYEILFEDYGEKYDNESFTQGTMGECDFIEEELKYDKSLEYNTIDIFGAKPGAFSREDILTTEDFEMLVIAAKRVL